jgi:hypothetical protein
MIRRFPNYLWFWCAVSLGLAVSTGHPIGISVAAGMPFVALMPGRRAVAFEAALGYYAAGLWPMIPGLQRYIGPSTSSLVAAAIWIVCASLLSAPWAFVWISERRFLIWRVPAALVLTIAPPLGIIGFISPIAGAGNIFPGCAWIGLLLTALLPSLLLALTDPAIRRSRVFLKFAVGASIALAVGAHLAARSEAKPVPGWAAVNTHFGDVSRPFKDYL